MDTNSITRNIQESWHRRYGEDVIVAMAVNPHTVHVYWGLDPLKMGLLEAHLGLPWHGVAKVLRVCDVTWITFDGCNAHSTRDIQLDDVADNWYVRDLADWRDYVCLFGVLTRSGEFFALLRSNVVRTPCAAAAREPRRRPGPKVCFQPTPARSVVPSASSARKAEPADPPDWQPHFTGYSLQHPVPLPAPEQLAEEQPACP